MSFICIVFPSHNLESRKFSPVIFLGSILQKPVVMRQTRHMAKREFSKLFSKMDLQKEANCFNQLSPISLSIERENIDPDKFIDVDKSKKRQLLLPSFAMTEYPRAQREIIFRPTFFEYPEWSEQEFSTVEAIFKIYISADGFVEQIINEQVSGNPEIDAALARYIAKWRFTPTFDQSGQWQIIKIDSNTLINKK
jgi:hypothetical protein